MKPTLNEKFLAYLALFSGLSLSVVAEYYSILGLTSIFAAAVIPVVIMGIALGLGKITATLWLKQNWTIAPWTMRAYLFTAIIVLMIVTSMGIFGFLSKAHSDQSLVSGDVQAKISIYDEKIKTARENIDVNRKALKQMDEAVDQVMGRSNDEKGADKAVAVRRSQQKERGRLLAEIEAYQKTISVLAEERAPIAAEVRKVEAEVGPIKYIAAFVYGDTDTTVLEKAVTWVIIILIVVFDPMAVILLLASQISFQNFREREDLMSNYKPDDGPLTDQQIDQIRESIDLEWKEEGPIPMPTGPLTTWTTTAIHEPVIEPPQFKDPGEHPADTLEYQFIDEEHEPETPGTDVGKDEPDPLSQWNSMIAEAEKAVEAEKQEPPPQTYVEEPSGEYVTINGERFSKRAIPAGYVQNEEQKQSGKWQEITNAVKITEQEYLEKAKERREENNPNNPA
jgi:energy-converting hydrogenase Eha subunit A